jgi:hypothetical protein
VSYGRGPDGTRTAKLGGGGLVTALRSLVQYHDVTWIASAITDEDRIAAGETLEETSRDGSPYRVRLVAHDPQAYDWYYNVVANPMLWFVHHSLWDLPYKPRLDAAFHRAWQDGYAAVNENFAAAVDAELARTPGAAVFFHDYHLYLAPRLVRERRPDAELMHFVHVPWPPPDYWRILPKDMRSAIHEGLIANDVVGFHTDRWRRNFVYSVRELLGEDVTAKTVTAPISVDPAEFDELAQSDAVLSAERELVASRPEKLVVRVDRTDPSKNIVRGFRAFELYLDAHPEAHRRGHARDARPIARTFRSAAGDPGEARRVNDRFSRAAAADRPADRTISAVAAYSSDVLLERDRRRRTPKSAVVNRVTVLLSYLKTQARTPSSGSGPSPSTRSTSRVRPRRSAGRSSWTRLSGGLGSTRFVSTCARTI